MCVPCLEATGRRQAYKGRTALWIKQASTGLRGAKTKRAEALHPRGISRHTSQCPGCRPVSSALDLRLARASKGSRLPVAPRRRVEYETRWEICDRFSLGEQSGWTGLQASWQMLQSAAGRMRPASCAKHKSSKSGKTVQAARTPSA